MTATADKRRLRLLVITCVYLPDKCGGAPIFSDLCHGLAGRGMEVTVRCAYPYYPEWKDKSGRNGLRIDRTQDQGVTVERYGLFIPRNPCSLWQRLVYEASHFLSVCRSLPWGGGFDAVIAFCPLMGSVAFASLNKMFHRRPLLLNIQDLPADAAEASGMTRSGWLRGLFRCVQRILFNRADAWRSISPVMIEQLKGIRERGQPIVFIPDWLHPTVSQEICRLPSKVGRPVGHPVRLLYSGNIGTKQGLLDFCHHLQANRVPFDFRIQGDGGGAAQVRDWVASSGDDRFSFGPLVDEPGFVRALYEADLFVITERPGKGASFFPSKTIPAITSGTPILAVSNLESPLGCEVRNQRLGPWFSWDRCGDVARLLDSLESRPEELVEWQNNAIRRSRFYDRERCLDLFQRTLEDMVQGRTVEAVAPLVTTGVVA